MLLGFPGTIELQVDIKSFVLRSLNLHASNFTPSFEVENATHSPCSNGVSPSNSLGEVFMGCFH